MGRVRIALVLLALAGAVRASDLRGLDASERRIDLRALPARVALQAFDVVVRVPDDPEIRSRGGSGGPMIEIEVARRGGPPGLRTVQQAIGLWVADLGAEPPEFSAWSKTGVATPVLCRLQAREGRYCATWCEDYEVRESGLARMGGPRRFIGCE